MRWLICLLLLLLVSCRPRLDARFTNLTADEMLQRSTHVFTGVIENEQIDRWTPFRAPDQGPYWAVLRRRVRLENVLRGSEARPRIDVYEIHWAGGATGNWNSTQEGERDLFPVVLEKGRYRLVQDWNRSIFPVSSGKHDRLPLTEARPFWERVALLMLWPKPGSRAGFIHSRHRDPGNALSRWRVAKIARGLLRHPIVDVRLAACEYLLHLDMAQDQRWDDMSEKERSQLNRYYNAVPISETWVANRRFEGQAGETWKRYISYGNKVQDDRDVLRFFTTMRDTRLRRDYCEIYQKTFPGDPDTGCPADKASPARVVTADGDVPLVGAWPDDTR